MNQEVYVVFASAQKQEETGPTEPSTRVLMRPYVTLATSVEQAQRVILGQLARDWPAAEGWTRHETTAQPLAPMLAALHLTLAPLPHPTFAAGRAGVH